MYPIDPGASIGHVALRVGDLDGAIAFYHGVLGMDVVRRFGDRAAFVSAGGYHHHIGLFVTAAPRAGGSGTGPSAGPGLEHLAIRYPTRRALARGLQNVLRSGIPIEGAADHGDTESVYLRDHDGNGVELYADLPPEQWGRRPGGPFDAAGLLAELEG